MKITSKMQYIVVNVCVNRLCQFLELFVEPKFAFSGRHCFQVHGPDHLELELHDEGRPPLPHHLHRHHVGLRVRRSLHFQHGSRFVLTVQFLNQCSILEQAT